MAAGWVVSGNAQTHTRTYLVEDISIADPDLLWDLECIRPERVGDSRIKIVDT